MPDCRPHRHREVRGVGASEKRWIRRLGAPGCGNRGDGDGAYQPNEEHDAQVPAETMPERRPEPVDRDTENSAHGARCLGASRLDAPLRLCSCPGLFQVAAPLGRLVLPLPH